MCLDDGLHQAQPQAQSAFCTAFVSPKQPLPDVRQFVGRNADAGISDGKQTPIAIGPDLDEHLAGGWCVFDRVIEQIRRHLLEAHSVG
jgi:hypothetical protein